MQLTVLGKSPAWQDAGGACSGYLVEEDGYRLLVDCGNGVFSELRRHLDYVDLDAVVVSHLHADHSLDLIPFSFALLVSPRQQPVPVPPWPGTDHPARPRLHLPPGGREGIRTVAGAFGMPDLVERAFRVREYDPLRETEAGPFRLRFAAVPHFIPTWAIEVCSTRTGARLVHGADCSPNDRLVTLAAGADLLLVEATLPRPERQGPRGHLTAEEAGEHARAAGVGRAVLTHVSDEQDPADVAARARGVAGETPVEVAVAGARYPVGEATPPPGAPEDSRAPHASR